MGDPLENPFEDADWLPENNPARTTYWDHETVLKVLDEMYGSARSKMTLIFGTGMELGAAQELNDMHLRDWKSRIVIAPGTKNEFPSRPLGLRRQLGVESARFSPRGPVACRRSATRICESSSTPLRLRRASSKRRRRARRAGKKLWKAVKPHTIHDARHSYCFNRILGLDGEPKQDLKFCAHQLGHGSEQMVMHIYAKANMEERIRRAV